MIRCTKCLLPETHETIEFDTKGACNVCNNHETKANEIDWNVQKKELTN